MLTLWCPPDFAVCLFQMQQGWCFHLRSRINVLRLARRQRVNCHLLYRCESKRWMSQFDCPGHFQAYCLIPATKIKFK